MFYNTRIRFWLIAIFTICLQSALFAKAFLTTWQTDFPEKITSLNLNS